MKLLSWGIPPLKQKRIFTRVLPTITEVVLCNTPENSRFEPKNDPLAKEKSFELKTVINCRQFMATFSRQERSPQKVVNSKGIRPKISQNGRIIQALGKNKP